LLLHLTLHTTGRDGTVARTLQLQIDKLGGISSEPVATTATSTTASQRSVTTPVLTPELSGSAESIGAVHRGSTTTAVTTAGTSGTISGTTAASMQHSGGIHLTMSAARFGARPGCAVSGLKPAQDLVIVEVIHLFLTAAFYASTDQYSTACSPLIH
jgi:hypothetical protein